MNPRSRRPALLAKIPPRPPHLFQQSPLLPIHLQLLPLLLHLQSPSLPRLDSIEQSRSAKVDPKILLFVSLTSMIRPHWTVLLLCVINHLARVHICALAMGNNYFTWDIILPNLLMVDLPYSIPHWFTLEFVSSLGKWHLGSKTIQHIGLFMDGEFVLSVEI